MDAAPYGTTPPAPLQTGTDDGALTGAIVAFSNDAIITKTLEGIVTSWNAAAERLFGYTEAEAIGRSLVGLIIPEEYSSEERMILARLRSGQRIGHYETVRRTKDGRRLEVALTISPLFDAAGQIVGASKIARDITERKAAERALEEERRRLEILNETGRRLSSTLDLQTLIQTVTDAGCELTGAEFGAFFYNSAEGDDKSFMPYALSGTSREAFEHFGWPRATALFGPTFQGRAVIRLDDVRQDPRYAWTEPGHGLPSDHRPVRSYLAVPVVSRSGEVLGGLFFGHSLRAVFTERSERIMVGVAAQAAAAIDNARLYETAQRTAAERDRLLSSERAARNHAERMSSLKDEFLATLSHELRTPLSAILGWTQVLRRGPRSPEDLNQALETIERNARAQARLVEDLLDMSRIASGRVRLDIQPATPMSFIQAAVEALRPAAEAKGVHMEVTLDPLAGPVSGDPGRLQQVIWNLLSNAIKFTPRNGRVQVVLKRVDSQVEIDITDSGIGIAPEFLPHVFERFRQGDASTTRRHGGLGLGLSIVKQLVELHGGTVCAMSPGIDQGATFTVQLPLSGMHRESERPRQHPRTGATVSEFRPVNLSGIKALVVDDENDARQLVERLLRDCGAEVLLARDAAQALHLVESERPTVLVSDIGMPDMDGYELLRRIRDLGAQRGGDVPAIALTAFARSEDRTRALRAGYLTQVSKPVEPSELVATVATVATHTLR